MMSSRVTSALGVLLASAAALGCDDGAGPASGVPVSVAFTATGMVAAEPASGSSYLAPRSVEIGGTNGTLTIDELRVIVAEFELQRLHDDDCANDDDACEEFDAGPAFVNVPLEGGQAVAVTARVEPDIYDELEFEIEDLDDEDDPVEAQRIAAVRSEILAEFPGWPREASMLVVGTFTPTDGEPIPFRAFFEAEVEIEMDLVPPVTITDDGAGATFTVRIDPGLWFRNADGSVRNLALLDYDETGRVVEFEVEIENGFAEVDFDD